VSQEREKTNAVFKLRWQLRFALQQHHRVMPQ
jgi:hypothetical protein